MNIDNSKFYEEMRVTDPRPVTLWSGEGYEEGREEPHTFVFNARDKKETEEVRAIALKKYQKRHPYATKDNVKFKLKFIKELLPWGY